MNQAVYTNDIKRLGNALRSPMIPAPPLKFRTAGFPQYGFKLELDSDQPLTDTDFYIRAFNSGVTSLGCRVYLRGQQSIAAAGLTPA
jgi:hypothetical protein